MSNNTWNGKNNYQHPVLVAGIVEMAVRIAQDGIPSSRTSSCRSMISPLISTSRTHHHPVLEVGNGPMGAHYADDDVASSTPSRTVLVLLLRLASIFFSEAVSDINSKDLMVFVSRGTSMTSSTCNSFTCEFLNWIPIFLIMTIEGSLGSCC